MLTPRRFTTLAALTLTLVAVLAGSSAAGSPAHTSAATAWDLEVTAGYNNGLPPARWAEDIRVAVTMATASSAVTHVGFTVALYRRESPARWHWGFYRQIDGILYFDSALDDSTAVIVGAQRHLRLHGSQTGSSARFDLYVDGQLVHTVVMPSTVLGQPGAVTINQPIGFYRPANVPVLQGLAVRA